MEACPRPQVFMTSYKRQSSGRKRKILKKSKNTVKRTLKMSTNLYMSVYMYVCMCMCLCRLHLRIIVCGRISRI